MLNNELKSEIYFLILKCKTMANLLNCLGLGSENILKAMDFDNGIDEIIANAGLSLSDDLQKLCDILQDNKII
ncbi:hypothetical protein [Campylobacter ureolyticus]|uniref:Uncharacterized protein n=1 Tax=Campylobacter ureolyticus TaxID=827 RepID=A0A6N2RSI2_9BACT